MRCSGLHLSVPTLRGVTAGEGKRRALPFSVNCCHRGGEVEGPPLLWEIGRLTYFQVINYYFLNLKSMTNDAYILVLSQGRLKILKM